MHRLYTGIDTDVELVTSFVDIYTFLPSQIDYILYVQTILRIPYCTRQASVLPTYLYTITTKSIYTIIWHMNNVRSSGATACVAHE
jgi:hypothetical protein